MSYNQNGLLVDAFTVNDYHSRISQGTIVGITLGWFFGAIGLYALGLLIIWKCCKQKTEEESSRVSNSVQQKQVKEIPASTQGRHRKQMFGQNPTLQMVNVTDSNEIDSHEINLGFNRNKYLQQMNREQDNEENHEQ